MEHCSSNEVMKAGKQRTSARVSLKLEYETNVGTPIIADICLSNVSKQYSLQVYNIIYQYRNVRPAAGLSIPQCSSRCRFVPATKCYMCSIAGAKRDQSDTQGKRKTIVISENRTPVSWNLNFEILNLRKSSHNQGY